MIPSPRILIGLLIAALFIGLMGFSYHKGHEFGAAEVQQKWDADRLAIANQTITIARDEKAKSERLAADNVQLRKDTHAQITRLSASLDDAIERLRERPARSDPVKPDDPSSGAVSSGTGATLFREDAEFLERESARADRIRIELVECQAAYGKARSAVMGVK